MRKSKYAEIGRSGTGDEFIKAFKRVADPSWRYDDCSEKRKILTDEAVQAFCDGHPEKVQAMLSNPAAFAEKGRGYYNAFVSNALCGITEKSDDKFAGINKAFARIPEQKRKEILGQALYTVIYWGGVRAEPLVDPLLKSGADPNVEVDGKTGWILALAVIYNMSDSDIKSLYDNGARFEDALPILQGKDYYQKYISSMLLQREKLEGTPAAVPEAQMERHLQLEQRVDELAVEVQRLTALLEGQVSSPKAEETTQPGIRLKKRSPSAP